MKKRKTFNESFMDAYKDNNLSSYDLDTKAHVELDPAFAGAVESSKKIRDNMKDAFKEQDKLVKDFLSLQDLEENPKIKSRPELKAMKLSESELSNKSREVNRRSLKESLSSGWTEDFHYLIAEFMPTRGEGDTMASQAATAVNKLIYKFYNDGDVFDNTHALEGWANDLSTYANWLFKFVPKSASILSGIEDCYTEEDYQELLRDLAAAVLNEETLDSLADQPAVSSIYSQSGPFEFVEREEDDDYYESLRESVSLNEDYSNFIGRPLKDFLYNIDGRTILNVDFENKDTSSGFNGFQGMAQQLPWYTSDKVIKDIQLGDDRYYKFKILTESKVLNESSIEDMIKAFENRIDELEDVKNESLKESGNSFSVKDQVQRYIVKELEEEINDITANEIASKISGYDIGWCPADITPLNTRLRTQINYHILVIAGALTKMLFEEAPEQIRESLEEVENVISFPGSGVYVDRRSNGEYVITKGWDWDKLIVDGNDLIFDRKKYRITPQEYKKLRYVIFNESLNEAKQKLNEWTFTLTTNNVNDYIDSNVPLEDLGMMAWKWMSNDDLVDMLRANEYGFEEEDEIDDDLDESLNEANKSNNLPKDKVRSYKIVASDTDDNIVFVKKVNGYNQIIKHLNILKGNIPEGATQIYVTRDDDKEVYSAFINDDGTLDVLEDNLIMEMDDGDRPSLLNKVQADLGTESAADAKALRELSREGKGQVGFDEHEIGFMDDTFHLNSRNMKQINWAKEVADHYGFTYSDVKTIMKDGEERYYIDIYAPGISDDPLLGEE